MAENTTSDGATAAAPSAPEPDFHALDIRVGTVKEALLNPKARVPAYKLTVDFGPEFGTRTSSAQLTQNYSPEALVGTQVVAVVNLAMRRIAGVKSEILVLGAVSPEQGTILLQPRVDVADGTQIG
eukprot:CAMPEP_0206137856 /NCGR_PEP_ID=MMETSP1473-20131121/2896_1 /ASSEMBLY_ACC=CAM_ASM_001109 /TAXON_ID=1461547 /ORGANISM="Stichococcus sp, Strain RCC1054" /LENGTH=125 /DNA_ID=CAMNT_0053531111 /DNA_START=236 /DNA_END=613 /DNA_ORIENTATION=+